MITLQTYPASLISSTCLQRLRLRILLVLVGKLAVPLVRTLLSLTPLRKTIPVPRAPINLRTISLGGSFLDRFRVATRGSVTDVATKWRWDGLTDIQPVNGRWLPLRLPLVVS